MEDARQRAAAAGMQRAQLEEQHAALDKQLQALSAEEKRLKVRPQQMRDYQSAQSHINV